MNDLVNELTTKAQLTEEQAQRAIEVMKEYIMGQLPPMMQPMVENFLLAGKNKSEENDFMG